ncbi:MAG: CvpA family protein [Bacteroidota bacterium]|nr:CvpA family protein [Bacteroidota bacterium]
MNAIDIVIIIPVLWGFWRGFMKGAIMEAATFVAFFLGVWGGMHLSDGMAELIHKWTASTSPYIPLISFALVFVAILAAVFAVAKLVEKLVEKMALSFINKLLGGIVGTLKFVLILSVLFFVVDKMEDTIEIIPKETKNKSLLYHPVASIAPLIIPGMKSSYIGNDSLSVPGMADSIFGKDTLEVKISR